MKIFFRKAARVVAVALVLVAITMVLAMPVVAKASDGLVKATDSYATYLISERENAWLSEIDVRDSLQWTGRSQVEWRIPESDRDLMLQMLQHIDCRLPITSCESA